MIRDIVSVRKLMNACTYESFSLKVGVNKQKWKMYWKY